MKITLQMPEILVIGGCLSFILGVSPVGSAIMLSSGLCLGFFRWSLELARESEAFSKDKKD